MDIKIKAIKKMPNTEIISFISWSASLNKNGVTAVSCGEVGLPLTYPDNPSFIPFNQVKEQDVIQWLKSSLGEEELKSIELMLNKEIETKTNNHLPWQTTTGE